MKCRIQTSDGTKTVEGRILSPSFALHRTYLKGGRWSKTCWTLTHRPSGWAMVQHLRSPAEAKQVIQAVDKALQPFGASWNGGCDHA